MKRIIFLLSLSLLPSSVLAANSFTAGLGNLDDLIRSFANGVVRSTGYLMFTLAIVAFFWGIVQFIWSARQGSDGKENTKGKQFMLWGLIALFVMFSVWGIIKFAQGILKIEGMNTITVPTLGFSFKGKTASPNAAAPASVPGQKVTATAPDTPGAVATNLPTEEAPVRDPEVAAKQIATDKEECLEHDGKPVTVNVIGGKSWVKCDDPSGGTVTSAASGKYINGRSCTTDSECDSGNCGWYVEPETGTSAKYCASEVVLAETKPQDTQPVPGGKAFDPDPYILIRTCENAGSNAKTLSEKNDAQAACPCYLWGGTYKPEPNTCTVPQYGVVAFRGDAQQLDKDIQFLTTCRTVYKGRLDNKKCITSRGVFASNESFEQDLLALTCTEKLKGRLTKSNECVDGNGKALAFSEEETCYLLGASFNVKTKKCESAASFLNKEDFVPFE